MAKDIFSKIMKDYNNNLEIILEKKAFSEDVKNLLLSMLYKIENSYEDYKKVKVNVCNKKQFVEEILETIRDKCDEIEIIKPMSEQGKELYNNNINCIINKEENKIKTFQNEKSMLDAILQMRQQNVELLHKYELIGEPVKQLLTSGNNMNSLEIIRDFNGWSWDITIQDIKNITYNKIYQMLIILIGSKLIDTWINNRRDEEIEELPSNVILSSKYNENFGITKKEMQEERIDYIEKIVEKFKELYGQQLTKKFFEYLIQIIILEYSRTNEIYKEMIEKEIKDLKEELVKMESNKIYLENLSSQKKEITKQIREIDTILNDEKKLNEEYYKRNDKLPNKDKIFSVSHLRLMLEKQRNKNLEQIKNINKKMEPKEFVQIKKALQEKVEFYTDIRIQENTKENSIRLQRKLEKIFLQCFSKKIEKSAEKKQIENLIYELRYYKLMPTIIIQDTQEIEKQLVKKACEQKVLTQFSQNEHINYQILKEIFITKIIDINTIIYMLKYTKGILTLNIYDANTHDETKKIEIQEKTELSVKLSKKIKIWQ